MFLVTGGAGFIGSHVIAALCAREVPVRVLDDLSTGRAENLDDLPVDFHHGSITDPDALVAAMEGCRFVIHMAARPGVPVSCEDPVGCDEVNVHGTVMVFQAARAAGVRRVIYASSSAVYGEGEGGRRREDDPVSLSSPYGAAKAANELYGEVFSRDLGVECVGLRLFNVFGPRQDPGGPYAAVIPRFIQQALTGQALTVFGDGEQSRDFVPVADVVQAVLQAVTAPRVGGRVYNVGTGHGTTVNALARQVIEAVGRPVDVRRMGPRPGDVRHAVADIARARTELGWEPRTDFAAAMAETIGWTRRRLEHRPPTEASELRP